MASSLLIVGTGALATLFAARFASAGVDVTMLGEWQDGLQALNSHGAYIDGVGVFPVKATNDPSQCRGSKTALVLVKSWQTERVAQRLADCLAKDGLAVTLQNGLGNDEVLANNLGPGRVGRGVTTLGATLTGPAKVRPGGDGQIILQAHPCLGPLVDKLRIANFEYQVVENVASIIWGKLILNAAINPLSALLQVANGDLATNPSAKVLLQDLAVEAAAVANAFGIILPYPDPATAVVDIATRTAANTSSMLQDVRRGAPTEIDAINGGIVRLGVEMSIPVPLNRAMWLMVRALSVRGKIMQIPYGGI